MLNVDTYFYSFLFQIFSTFMKNFEYICIPAMNLFLDSKYIRLRRLPTHVKETMLNIYKKKLLRLYCYIFKYIRVQVLI